MWFTRLYYYIIIIIIIIIIILNPRKTRVRKNSEIENAGKTTAPGGRPCNTKPSYNKTELNRNSVTEMRWNKKEVSHVITRTAGNPPTKVGKLGVASLFMGPRDSKAIGWKQYWLSSVPYLVLLWVATILATAPADPIADWM